MAPLLLAFALLGTDPDELVRRAEVRLAHQNPEGARELLERAVSHDPTCGPAWKLLVPLLDEGQVEARLAWLEHGTPLDLPTCREYLVECVGSLQEPTPEARQCLERWAMVTEPGAMEPCGPWFPWQRPDVVPFPWPPAGPLRSEALDGAGPRHPEALRRIAARLEREHIADPAVWGLVVLLRTELGDEDAWRSFPVAEPKTLEERCFVEAAAFARAPDPVAWWAQESGPLLEAMAGDVGKSFDARPLWSTVRGVLAEHSDLPGLVRLAAAELAWGDAAEYTLWQIEHCWHLDEAYHAAGALEDTGGLLLRARLLREMLQDDDAFSLLEEAARGVHSPSAVLLELDRAREACGLPKRIPEPPTDHVRVFPSAGPTLAAIAEAIAEGKMDAALDLADTLPADFAQELDYLFFSPESLVTTLQGGLGFLRAVARADRLSNQRDAVLRMVCLAGTWRTDDVPGFQVRLRTELMADAAFRGSPAGAYVLSLLFDPGLQPDAGEMLRRAYATGFRSRGLLLDLSWEGEPVLDELAAFDPVAARLERALRGDGPEGLEGFLEEDAAWPHQRERARKGLMNRRRSLPALSSEEEGPIEVVRRIRRLMEKAPLDAWWDWLDEKDSLAEPYKDPPRPTVTEVLRALRQGRIYEAGWPASAAAAVREGGEPVLGEMLGSSRGHVVARHLLVEGVDLDLLLAGVRNEERLHPLDLRWVPLETDILRRLGREEEAAERENVQALRRTRSLRYAQETVRFARNPDEAHPAVRRFLEAAKGETVQNLFRCLPHATAADPATELLEALLARCGNDEDRNLVAQKAGEWELEDLRHRMDTELASSSDPQVRVDALSREYLRPGHTPDPDTLARLAREPQWKPEHAARLWALTVADAAAANRDDLMEEGLGWLWSSGFVEESVPGWAVIDEILDRIASGSGSPALYYFLSRLVGADRLPDDAGPALDRAWELGFCRREAAWRRRCLAAAPGQAVAACERLVAAVRDPRDLYSLLDVDEVAAALLLSGRTEEAVACVDARAKACGAVLIDDVEAATTRFRCFEYHPFSWVECFQQGVMPAEALAAASLHGLGLHDVARDRLTRALEQDWPEEVRWELLRARAGIGIDVAGCDLWESEPPRPLEDVERFAVQTMRDLKEIALGAPSAMLRMEAWLRVLVTWERHPATRVVLVEDLLAANAALPDAPRDEVLAWEARLGQEDPSAREEAESELQRIGVSAVPLLRALRQSGYAEVRLRAEAVLEALASP